MSFRVRWSSVLAAGVLAVSGDLPAAFASGTCSTCPPPTNSCTAISAGSSRAYGLSANLAGNQLIAPTPDSNVQNPDELLAIDASQTQNLLDAHVLRVSETSENDADGPSASATAETAAVKVLRQPNGEWLLTADAVKAVSTSSASGTTATSSAEGSAILNLTLAGQPLGDITAPVDLDITEPLTGTRITVRLLQQIPFGAKAGKRVPIKAPDAGPGTQDPVGSMTSGLSVNGIRATVRDRNGGIIADVIVAHADSSATVRTEATCALKQPSVSGFGLPIAARVDETLIDDDNTLLYAEAGRTRLPSTGGADSASLAHVGPLTTPLGDVILESNTAYSDTSGTVNASANKASSQTTTGIEDLKVLENPLSGGYLLQADVARSECTADIVGNTLKTTGSTTLLNVVLGGKNLCEEAGLEDGCSPAPNTNVSTREILGLQGLQVILNEQKPVPNGIEVTAVHVHVLGPGNFLDLPVGAEVIVSRSHCDAAPACGQANGGCTAPGTPGGLPGLPQLPPQLSFLQQLLNSLLKGGALTPPALPTGDAGGLPGLLKLPKLF